MSGFDFNKAKEIIKEAKGNNSDEKLIGLLLMAMGNVFKRIKTKDNELYEDILKDEVIAMAAYYSNKFFDARK
jgi:glycerol-3-phosphate O-acyltransferase